MNNIIAINKPKGPTSHDIIDEVRRITDIRKVGHGGTLDPLASGVLVVAIGREGTKRLSQEVAKEKEYVAEVRLGMTSSTDDEEGEKEEKNVGAVPARPAVEEAVAGFVGEIMQKPPIYSALKIKGKPAYKYARAHEKAVGTGLGLSQKEKDLPKLEPRQVLIKSIEVLEYEWPLLRLRVTCGPGVYIRALARDIGEKLGVGGYLAALERTKVGEHKIEEAIKMEDLANKLKSL